jgi:D-alanyl-D-alanine carboxypeptidase
MDGVDRRWLLGSAAALASLTRATATTASPPAPAPPAGAPPAETKATRVFARWLDQMNAGDPKALDAYLAEHYPTNTDPWISLAQVSGGLVVDRIEVATARSVTALVHNRRADGYLRLVFDIDPDKTEEIVTIGLRAVGPPPGVSPAPRQPASRLFRALHAQLRAAAAREGFSGNVLVSKAGRPLFVESFGFSDRSRRLANTATTRFRYASLGKMFTSVAVMQLAESGKLDLAAPVSRYLPDYPNREIADRVTIDQLMTHTGGTGEIFGPEFDAHRNELRRHVDYIRLYGERAPLFTPGSRASYSDYGFILLGEIVERASGQDYYRYISERVLSPAHMRDTGYEPEDVAGVRRATGYSWVHGRLASTAAGLPYRGSAAGGGYSTVSDLAAFGAALTGARLLGADTTRRLLFGETTIGGKRYRYDIAGKTSSGVAFIGHDGQDAGAHCKLMVFPDSGYAIVVLSNFDPPSGALPANYIVNRLQGLS